jgi:hypothetical protein
MSNRMVHGIAGIAAGYGLAKIAVSGDGVKMPANAKMIGVLGGLVGSCIADIIDPPTSYRHRKLGHSLLLGASASAVLFLIANELSSHEPTLETGGQVGGQAIRPSQPAIACFLRGLATGHISHLALDSISPMGIPL